MDTYYEIHISENGVHLFTTASIKGVEKLRRVYKELNEKFLESEGYNLTGGEVVGIKSKKEIKEARKRSKELNKGRSPDPLGNRKRFNLYRRLFRLGVPRNMAIEMVRWCPFLGKR